MRRLEQLLERSAAAAPEAVAVHCPHAGPVRYRELDELARRTAGFLSRHGVGNGARVGVLLPKSALGVAAMQGALRVGAAYVPIDPLSPLARTATIVRNAELSALIGASARLAELETAGALPRVSLRFAELGALASPELEPFAAAAPAEPAVGSDALAYVLYTSGSTGLPKGVCISHANALAFIEWAAALLEPRPDDVFGNHAPFHFDLSVLDLYVAFGAGASVALAPETAALAPSRLVDLIVERGVSIWYSVPSALCMMLRSGGLLERGPLPLRAVCFAGEPFPPRELAALRRGLPAVRLVNLYGPTETNVCTYYEVPAEVRPDAPVPIGVAASGDSVWAEKEDGTPAAPGEVGELLVLGPSVMLGYFGEEPRRGGEPYRTGDLVRVREDAGFDFIGRRDQQVKLRGHRIELGEVETALLAHPDVEEVAVTVVGSGLDAKLVAAAVARAERQVPLLELKATCAARVPRAMIIERVVWLEALPRTPTGKLDRIALADACR